MALYYAQQFATTKLSVSGGIDTSQTTGIVLQSVTGIDTAKAGVLCLSWSDPINEATYEYITYTSINGSKELVGVARGAEGTTGRAHGDLSDVAWVLSESHINNLNAAMVAEHSEAGVHTAISKLAYSTLNAPEGFLLNGKIVPSVASNNLTVAIKGMDGNDPSASNPVYCRIDNVVRTITSALAITANAGTNWCAAGSAELATKEIDYFVYLGWNSSGAGGIMTGFSRIPYATTYSEFNMSDYVYEKSFVPYGNGSAAATDGVVVIGRFAATLSAGAGYTWTVPTFTATNLIQRPIYETRQLAWTPAIVFTGSAAPTTPAGTHLAYKIEGNTLSYAYWQQYSGAGTAITNITVSLPFGIASPYISQYVSVARNVVAGSSYVATDGRLDTSGAAGDAKIVFVCSSSAVTSFSSSGTYFL